MTILSTDLVKQFVESTHDETETKGPSRFYGTASVRPDGIYVILDGSTIPTPVSMATDAQTGDRVLVEIVNHQARVIQNINKSNSDIVAGRIEHDETGVFQELRVGKEYVDTLIASDITADSIVADRAKIEDLEADNATITGKLTAAEADISDLQAADAEISNLVAGKANITDLDAVKADIETLEAGKANITDLDAVKADIETLEAGKANITDLDAVKADIETLETTKLSAEDADIRYLNVDFSKIDKAWLQEFYAQSGIIKDLVIGESTVTGHLVGVTISGDLIEGNTVKADKLVVKGEDGLYYKLNIEGGSTVTEQLTKEMLQNGLDGNNIIANTITAEKISVDDLIAFDATIGGFNIGENSLYSGVKSSIDNTTRGIYMDNQGQIYFGDNNNYLKYYKFADNDWRLEVAAKNIIFGASGKDIEEAFEYVQGNIDGVQNNLDNLEIGGRNLAISSLNFDRREIIYSVSKGVEIIEYDDRTAIKFTGENTAAIMGCYLITPYTVTVENDVITGSNFDDDTFIISFDYKCESSLQTNNFQLRLFSYNDSTDTYKNAGRLISTTWPIAQLTATSNWKRAKTGVLNINNPIAFYGSGTVLTGTFVIGIGYVNNPGVAFEMSKIKLEKGNKATDWTPAPEDVDSGISNAQTAAKEAADLADSKVGISKYYSDKEILDNTIDSINTSIGDINSTTDNLSSAISKELVRNGFAEFTNDPKLTLGKTTSAWKVIVTNDGIFLQKSSNDVASLSKETSSEETTLRADNARLANVKFRSANGGGKLGIVAQSNGHVSLKEI